jgi:hypothetical protein
MRRRGYLCLIPPLAMAIATAASPAAHKEISRLVRHAGIWPVSAPPVIADGKLYLREQNNLYCYNIHE